MLNILFSFYFLAWVMSITHAMMDKMMSMQKTNDPDNDFALMMKMHHQGAIEMSNDELKSGDDAQMKKTAQMIIDWKNHSI